MNLNPTDLSSMSFPTETQAEAFSKQKHYQTANENVLRPPGTYPLEGPAHTLGSDDRVFWVDFYMLCSD